MLLVIAPFVTDIEVFQINLLVWSSLLGTVYLTGLKPLKDRK